MRNGKGHEIGGISSNWEIQGEWVVDDRLRQRIWELTQQLAIEEQERLAGLGTFVEIEDLTAEIGDQTVESAGERDGEILEPFVGRSDPAIPRGQPERLGAAAQILGPLAQDHHRNQPLPYQRVNNKVGNAP